MLRSMFTGIGGIRNFQYKLDVIGNNISNVNTYGYKKRASHLKISFPNKFPRRHHQQERVEELTANKSD